MDKNAIKICGVSKKKTDHKSKPTRRKIWYHCRNRCWWSSVDGVLPADAEKKHRKALIDQVKQKDFDQIMGEAAYTWFSRFIALRFMEVNGYLPSLSVYLRMIIITSSRRSSLRRFILNLTVSIWKRFMRWRTPMKMMNCISISSSYSAMVSVRFCREVSADWKDAVQIIGWLYQYYNS